MSGSACSFYKLGCLNVPRGTSFAAPTNFFVGLSTTDPTFAGTGITEPVGNAYARVQVAASALQWDAPSVISVSGFFIQNTNIIQFATPTGTWGTLSHWFMSDQVSGGNIWFRGTIDVSGVPTPQTFSAGADVKFLAGALDILVTELLWLLQPSMGMWMQPLTVRKSSLLLIPLRTLLRQLRFSRSGNCRAPQAAESPLLRAQEALVQARRGEPAPW